TRHPPPGGCGDVGKPGRPGAAGSPHARPSVDVDQTQAEPRRRQSRDERNNALFKWMNTFTREIDVAELLPPPGPGPDHPAKNVVAVEIIVSGLGPRRIIVIAEDLCAAAPPEKRGHLGVEGRLHPVRPDTRPRSLPVLEQQDMIIIIILVRILQ